MDFGYGKLSQDLQAIRNYFIRLDSLAISARFGEHVRVAKALSLIWIAASLEDFWKSYLRGLCVCVGNASPHKRRKHLAASAIYYFDSFGSLGEGKRIKRWQRAVNIISDFSNATLLAAAIPYDGRTIRPEHIVLAWQVFCLSGPEFPSPVHRQDLNTLAEQRNEIAHGTVAPSSIGGSFTISDLQRRLERMEELAMHCIIAADAEWG